jgi:hypothetical protein
MRPLTAASDATAAAVVAQYLRDRGIEIAEAALVPVGSPVALAAGGTMIRLEQNVAGLRLYGAYAKASFSAQGELFYLVENLAAGAPSTLSSGISPAQGLNAALRHLYPGQAVTVGPPRTNGNTVIFERTPFFHAAPHVTRVAFRAADGSIRAGMLVETWNDRENLLHHTLVGPGGQVLFVELRTASDSYNVFAISPRTGAQTIVSGPGSGNAQSPSGWLSSGPHTSIDMSGNNVHGYLDVVRKFNVADSGGLAVTTGDFVTDANLAQSPATASNREVAVQNLFYHTNLIHDILYLHGFDEAAGNFQEDNYDNGGEGSDSVNAEAQDGSGTNNANFSTPADGSNPRMQVFLWDGADTFQVHLNTAPGDTYGAAGSEFGARLRGSGLTGDVIVGVDASQADSGGGTTGTFTDGCQALTNAVSGRIVLVDRGSCDFVVKAQNAASAGAIGVIVANNRGGTDIEPMGGQGRVRIPALMISQNDGAELKTLTSPNVTMRPNPATLSIDASLDADVIYHEYGHGLSWRMIGGMSGPISGALGEGISDALAMLVNGDDRIGEYASSTSEGIRRAPYEGYPNTYADITGSIVHDDGEIYAAIVWRLRELFLQGGGTASELLTHFVNAMNHIPESPSYEDMRAGWLAVMDDVNDCLVWQAFAQFGVGEGSSATAQRRGVTVVESFTLPAQCPAPTEP